MILMKIAMYVDFFMQLVPQLRSPNSQLFISVSLSVYAWKGKSSGCTLVSKGTAAPIHVFWGKAMKSLNTILKLILKQMGSQCPIIKTGDWTLFL